MIYNYSCYIKNRKLVAIKQFYGTKSKVMHEKKFYSRIGKMKIQGEIQRSSQRLIEKRFEGWFRSLEALNLFNQKAGIRINYRFVLVTLTLPAKQFHSDQDIKKFALKPFIKQLERKHKVYNWAWKAETQRNGNIHFHVVIDKFVKKELLNEIWFRYMNKLGYSELFEKKYPGKSQPSCNVKGQKSMRNPVSYITKYFSKENENRKVNGAIWRMSEKLLDVELFKFDADNLIEEKLIELSNSKEVKVFNDDYYSVLKFDKRIDESIFSAKLKAESDLFYLNLGRYLQSTQVKSDVKKPEKTDIEQEKRNKELLKLPESDNLQQLYLPNFRSSRKRENEF